VVFNIVLLNVWHRIIKTHALELGILTMPAFVFHLGLATQGFFSVFDFVPQQLLFKGSCFDYTYLNFINGLHILIVKLMPL
jgi:hypothetical protein